MTEMPKVKKVKPLGGLRLRVQFEGERAPRSVDLTGLAVRSRHFAPLVDDAEAFAAAEVVEGGLGIGWPVQTEFGRLDVSAATLHRIAEEQQPMTGAEFAAWRNALGLSLTEAAGLLGLSRRTIMGYVRKDELPAVVAIACRALSRDKNLLAAHFVPTRRATRRAA
jgi:predicted DNA-binding transcriptional regulator AlpA